MLINRVILEALEGKTGFENQYFRCFLGFEKTKDI
jgi:hypothetical protein